MLKPDPFLVHIDEIPSAGIHTECPLPEGWLAQLLPPAYHTSDDPGSLVLDLKLADDQLQVSGHVRADVLFDCGRCAKTLAMTLERTVTVLYVPDTKSKVKVDAEFEEEPPEDLFTYTAHTFSVEAPFVDSIVLSLTPFPVCRKECKGLCLTCGEDLNESTCACHQPAQESQEPLRPLDTPLADAVVMLRGKFEKKGSKTK